MDYSNNNLRQRAKNFLTKKHFGQNFLISHDVLRETASTVLSTAQECNTFNILEVGPGIGFLTDYLIEDSQNSITALDLDKDALKNIIPASNLTKIHGDILNYTHDEQHIAVGNLPYQIASKILIKYIGELNTKTWNITNCPALIFMFQDEVAQRLIAQPKHTLFNGLSLLIQAKTKIEYLSKVPKNLYYPMPKVNGGIVKITPYINPVIENLEPKNLNALHKLIKVAFNQRRKVLTNSLKSYINSADLESININPQSRPQDLSLNDFAQILQISQDKIKWKYRHLHEKMP